MFFKNDGASGVANWIWQFYGFFTSSQAASIVYVKILLCLFCLAWENCRHGVGTWYPPKKSTLPLPRKHNWSNNIKAHEKYQIFSSPQFQKGGHVSSVALQM